jgi:hypothetical protein
MKEEMIDFTRRYFDSNPHLNSVNWKSMKKQKFTSLWETIPQLLWEVQWKYLNEIIGPAINDNPKPFFSYVKKLKQDTVSIQQLSEQEKLKTRT